jgi:hypothetical protein
MMIQEKEYTLSLNIRVNHWLVDYTVIHSFLQFFDCLDRFGERW